jgi:hypothetical protein
VNEKHPDVLEVKMAGEEGNQLKIPSCSKNFSGSQFIVLSLRRDFREFGDSRGLSRKYLMKVLQGVRSLGREEIKLIIPNKFGVIFDGWTCDGTSQQ